MILVKLSRVLMLPVPGTVVVLECHHVIITGIIKNVILPIISIIQVDL